MHKDESLQQLRLASTHDVLSAWQAGRLSSRQAISLTGTFAVTDLYEAAANSDVPIRTKMTPREAKAAERATMALLALGVTKR